VNAEHGRPTTLPWWSRVLTWPFALVIYAYKATLSPFIGRQCRFEPTCSSYALEAYRTHGVLRGTALAARRLSRCHPLCKGGYDPVPPKE